jgi:hypothetical protein
MMPSPAQEMQWRNSEAQKLFLNGNGDDFLKAEGPARIEIRFSRKIEIYIFDIQVHQQRTRIPKRPTDLTVRL